MISSEPITRERRRILEIVSAGPTTLKDIMAETGYTRGTALGHIAFLRKRGLIEESEDKTKYEITKAGREVLRPPPIPIEMARSILNTVPPSKSFYFHTDIGKSIGLSASSLAGFCDMIQIVNSKSLEFHLYRGDFECWIRDTLGDNELANSISDLKGLGLRGEEIRSRLYHIVKERYKTLKQALKRI